MRTASSPCVILYQALTLPKLVAAICDNDNLAGRRHPDRVATDATCERRTISKLATNAPLVPKWSYGIHRDQLLAA
jgi:hypothetical protein